jgi:hypothetical protein
MPTRRSTPSWSPGNKGFARRLCELLLDGLFLTKLSLPFLAAVVAPVAGAAVLAIVVLGMLEPAKADHQVTTTEMATTAAGARVRPSKPRLDVGP